MTICKICKTEEQVEQFKEKREIFLCKNCKCIFSKESSHKDFPSIISQNKIRNSIQQKIAKRTAQHYIEYLKTKTDFPFQSAFDIGAGYGHFVSGLIELGVDANGIEAKKDTFEKKVTEKIQFGYFDENFHLKRKFDLISFNQCLYYFDDVFSILKKSREMLSNNGMLFISTVNTESDFRLKNKIWTQGCKICLSGKNFQDLESIGLKLIDISSFTDNLFVDVFLHRRKKLKNLQFLKNLIMYSTKMKKMIISEKNGVHNYILLKKIKID